jgi:hypothetical protein
MGIYIFPKPCKTPRIRTPRWTPNLLLLVVLITLLTTAAAGAAATGGRRSGARAGKDQLFVTIIY